MPACAGLGLTVCGNRLDSDGLPAGDYVQRVEPSVRGGKKMGDEMVKLILEAGTTV